CLSIDPQLNSISFRQNDLVKNFDIGDISRFIIVYSSAVDFPGHYGFAEYRYCRIYFQTGETIIITCLMIHDLQNTLEVLLKLKPEIKKVFLPFISKA
ncbi:MAG: hypothetical protein ABW036_13905, partial [Flavitalea sp.]